MTEMHIVRCRFWVRVPRMSDGKGRGFGYRSLPMTGWPGDALQTMHPPLVDDLLYAADRTYKVVERAWSYPEEGSMNWPSGGIPLVGPMLTIITEEVDSGPFRDEVPLDRVDS